MRQHPTARGTKWAPRPAALGKWILLALGVACLAYLLVFPSLVRWGVDRQLTALAGEEVSYELDILTPMRMRIRDLAPEGEGPWAIDSIDIRLTLRGLFQSRVDSIVVVGGRWTLEPTPEVDPSRVSLLERLAARQESLDPSQWLPLPFSTLSLRSCRLILDRGDRRQVIPIEGVWRDDGPTQLQGTGRTVIADRPFRWEIGLKAGPPNPVGRIRLQSEGADPDTDTPAASVTAEIEWPADKRRINLDIEAALDERFHWAGSPLNFERLKGRLSAGVDLTGSVEHLEGYWAIQEPTWRSHTWESWELALERHDDRIELRAAAAGPDAPDAEGVVTLPNRLDLWVDATKPIPVGLSMNLKADPDLWGALLPDQPPPAKTGTIRFTADGTLDPSQNGDAQTRQGWELTLPETGVTLHFPEIRMQNLIVEAFAFDGLYAVHLTEDHLAIRDLGSRLEIDRLLTHSDEQPFALGPVRLASSPTPNDPMLSLPTTGPETDTDNLPIGFESRWETAEPVPFEGPDLKGSISHFGLTLMKPPTTPIGPNLLQEAEIAIAHLEDTRQEISVSDLTVRIPPPPTASAETAQTQDPADRGNLSIGTVRIRETSMAGIEGTVARPGPGRIEVDAVWSPTDESSVRLTGSAHWEGERPSIEATLRSGSLVIEDGDPIHRLIQDFSSAEVTGRLSLFSRLSIPSRTAPASWHLGLNEMEIAHPDSGLRLNGVNGTLGFQGPVPFRTDGRQRIAWQGLTLGDVELGNGYLDASLDGRGPIHFEEIHLRVGETGRIWVHPFRFNPFDSIIETQVFCEAIDLKDWLEPATQGHVQGEGKLNGRLAFRMQTQPRLRVAIAHSQFYATEDGFIQVASPQLPQTLTGIDPSDSQEDSSLELDETIRNRIIQSLQDFQYSRLTLELVPANGGLSMKVHAEGEGRKVPQPLTLTLNVNGIDQLISLAIGMKLAVEREE